MKFDPATLLTTAFLALLLFGLVLIAAARRSRSDLAALWWIAGFLLGASGFLLLIVAPLAAGSMPMLVANTLFLSAYGCSHAGARSLVGRKPPVWSLVLAVTVWPVITSLFDPEFGTRIVICSLLVCGYSAAIAVELVHGAVKDERNRFIAAALCGAHALFYLSRAVFGPTLGLTNASTEAVVSSWGAAIALEIVLFSALLAMLVVGITAERMSLKERHAAFTDFLTGIGNRRAFDTAMHAIMPAVDDRGPAMLLLLDLDGFKKVNDRLGHHAGDTLLKAFASVIQQRLPDPRMFWRIGGDEFAILLRDCNLPDAKLVKEALRRAIDTSAAIQQTAGGANTSASIGYAFVRANEPLSELVGRADAALYRDKNMRAPSSPSFAACSATRAA